MVEKNLLISLLRARKSTKTKEKVIKKRTIIPKMMKRGLRAIALQGAIVRHPIFYLNTGKLKII